MISRRSKILVDHNVFVPDGAEDLFYEDRYIDEEFQSFEDEGLDDDDRDGEDSGDDRTPAVPEKFQVISQVLRMTSSGAFVVDVVIETDDYPEDVEIDVRMAKEST